MSSKQDELPWTLTRKLFPIRLCFAIRINKSKDQSLANDGIDMYSPYFSYREFYVAGCQGMDPGTICVLLTPKKAGDDQDLVENVLYLEVLLP